MKLSSIDINTYLQLSGIEYSNILDKYIDSLRWSRKDAEELQEKLFLLNVYIRILENYKPGCLNGVIETNNCQTEEQIINIIEKISKLTGICFQSPGFQYVGIEKQKGIGFMQIGCSFVVS